MDAKNAPITREEYATRKQHWERELFDLTRRVKAGRVPVAIVFEGAQGAGMGRAIYELTEKMDPRVYTVHPIAPARGFEQKYPWMWRFWMKIPARGEIGIFDESWYLHVLGDRASGKLRKKEVRARYGEIASFERQLIADGTILIKLFFLIDEKTARRRYERAVEAGAANLKRRKKNLSLYKEWREAADEMLERTSTESSPWHVVPAREERFARARTFEIVIASLRQALDERKIPLPVAAPATPRPAAPASSPSHTTQPARS